MTKTRHQDWKEHFKVTKIAKFESDMLKKKLTKT